MDPAGYFVVIPQPDDETIICEHYNYNHTRQPVIEAGAADDTYREVIERDVLSRLDHAAYLETELTRPELALSQRLDYEEGGKPE